MSDAGQEADDPQKARVDGAGISSRSRSQTVSDAKNVTGGGPVGMVQGSPGGDTTQDMAQGASDMAKAQYQKEATGAKGPPLQLTGAQINHSNHSVRVTSKQKGAEGSMGMPSAAGAAIVDLDLHGQRSDLEGAQMMNRPGMRTAEGIRPGAGSGSRRGHSQGAK